MNTQIKRNFLEINSRTQLKEKKKPFKDLIIKIVDPPDFQLNKFFYKQIGKNYRWNDRLSWSESDWFKYTNNKNLQTYILKQKSDLVGYFEQIFYKESYECEIAYFGILEEYIGKNIGAYFLSEAIKDSFKIGSKRVWVHTCSLDHKHALNNYIARGMRIFKSEELKI